jgi:hypothetical protein
MMQKMSHKIRAEESKRWAEQTINYKNLGIKEAFCA